MAHGAQKLRHPSTPTLPQPPLHIFTQTVVAGVVQHQALQYTLMSWNFHTHSSPVWDPLPFPQPSFRFLLTAFKIHLGSHFLPEAFSDPHSCLSGKITRQPSSSLPNVPLTAVITPGELDDSLISLPGSPGGSENKDSAPRGKHKDQTHEGAN